MTERWTAWRARRPGQRPRPCSGEHHFFAQVYLGEFRRGTELRPLVAWDTCTCGLHRWSEVLAEVAESYAEVASS